MGADWHPGIVRRGERPRVVESPPIPDAPLEALSDAQRAALPNLIGIGAGKCGSSAVHAYLAAHPEVSASRRKEQMLFGSPRWLERLPEYVAQFDASKPVRTETSPTYSMDPVISSVPEQMAVVLGSPRLIYVVGDPVRRVLAHWGEQRSVGLERRSLEEALADAESPVNPYVAGSRFGHQLERYLAHFDLQQILVVDQHALRTRRRETLGRIFAFAGVAADYWSPAFDAEPNASVAKLAPNRLGTWVLDRTRGSARGKRLALVRGLTAAPVRTPALDDALRDRLRGVLAPDAARFRELTGQEFAEWTV